jgi:hypothetical protein
VTSKLPLFVVIKTLTTTRKSTLAEAGVTSLSLDDQWHSTGPGVAAMLGDSAGTMRGSWLAARSRWRVEPDPAEIPADEPR